MAIYHLSAKPVQRSQGRSATAAAAYRAGERIACEREGRTHDYRRRSGVDHVELVGWRGSRAELWNAAEAGERRKDGTPAREYEIALPIELERPAQIQLARRFARAIAKRQGVAVDIALHGLESGNPHAHLLCSTRQVEPGGRALGEKAPIEWSDKRRQAHGLSGRKIELEQIRAGWARLVNVTLEAAQRPERVDHRSLADQGIDRTPTTHLGPAASGLERRQVASDRGDENRRRQRQDRVWRTQLAAIEAEIERQAEIDAARRPRAGMASTLAGLNRQRPAPKPVAPAERPTIRTPTNAQRYRAGLLRQRAGGWIPDALAAQLAWVDRQGQADRIRWTDGRRMLDTGDQLTVQHGDQIDAERAVALAAARGWRSLEISGSEAWLEACARCAAAQGLKIAPVDDRQRQLLERLDVGHRPPQADYQPPTPGF